MYKVLVNTIWTRYVGNHKAVGSITVNELQFANSADALIAVEKINKLDTSQVQGDFEQFAVALF